MEKKEYNWAERYGFGSAKEYVEYMRQHRLWGSDEYIRRSGTMNKKLDLQGLPSRRSSRKRRG
uniref:Uncharacterized protein n=1 Tax=viral metagenome TaxID=1070528 RepID=A0A6M3X608_9ZZZZ